jgi:aquaporin Z
MKPYLMECIGTFFLLLAVITGQPLAIGLMLMALIYVGGHVSGGHYNPAVTLAVWLGGGRLHGNIIGYWIAQCLGAILASLALYFLVQAPLFSLPAGAAFLPAISFELLMTLIFCWVIVTVTSSDNYRGLQGMIIGLTLVAAATFGGMLNPAIAFAALIGSIKSGSAVILQGGLVHIVGPLVGAMLAGLLFKFFRK